MSTLLERVAQGDRAAISGCVSQFGPLVWALVSRRLGRGPDAEDVVQEVLLDVWKHAGRYDPERSSEATFVAVIARRRVIDRLRRTARRPEHLEVFDVAVEQQKQMDATIDAKRVLDELADFPPEQRQVLLMATLNGLSHAEIAEQTSLPLGTVKTHVRRGLQRIRARLASRSSDPGQQNLDQANPNAGAKRMEVDR